MFLIALLIILQACSIRHKLTALLPAMPMNIRIILLIIIALNAAKQEEILLTALPAMMQRIAIHAQEGNVIFINFILLIII